MQPLTFPCSACGRRMGVGLALAGKPVRCPHCQQVVTAPATAPPAPPAGPPPAANPGREAIESIFSDPEESEDSLFAPAKVRQVEMPGGNDRLSRPTPLTLRALAAEDEAKPPAPPPAEDPWLLADEGSAPGVMPAPARARQASAGRPLAWKPIAVAALAAYAAVTTVLAVWGWLRTPAPADPRATKADASRRR